MTYYVRLFGKGYSYTKGVKSIVNARRIAINDFKNNMSITNRPIFSSVDGKRPIGEVLMDMDSPHSYSYHFIYMIRVNINDRLTRVRYYNLKENGELGKILK